MRTSRATAPATRWLLTVPVLALILAGCGGGGGASKSATTGGASATPTTGQASGAKTGSKGGGQASTSAKIASFKYAPATIKVSKGGSITWTNQDSAEHTATADNGSSFDTGTLAQGKAKKVAFNKAGTFTYHCAFHPFMHGTVVVK